MLNSTLCATVTASVLHTSSYNASQVGTYACTSFQDNVIRCCLLLHCLVVVG